MNDTAPLLNDDDTLVSAKTQYGTEIRIYDDCFGPLWVCQNSLGVFGVIRACNWHNAESIMRDEILKPIPEEDVLEAYGYFVVEHNGMFEAMQGHDGLLASCGLKDVAESVCKQHMKQTNSPLAEGYSYQDNATGTGIVSHDLNGETINALTPELIEHLGLVIEAEDPDGNRYCVTSKGDEDESNNPTTDPAMVSDND